MNAVEIILRFSMLGKHTGMKRFETIREADSTELIKIKLEVLKPI